MLGREALEAAMRRALELAARGPVDNPNPRVGCVVLDPGGSIVSEGWHGGAGTRHAEVAALAALPEPWRVRARELTAVVTLEPCNHTGRTGPCSDALSEARIGTVVFAVSDPGAASSGGAAALREAGVAVVGGVLQSEGQKLLAPWLRRQGATTGGATAGATAGVADGAAAAQPSPRRDRRLAHEAEKSASLQARRPHVTVKWAQTLDGRAAAADGSSQWITGSAARRDAHRRRAAADAILVGTGTVIADDPALTARDDTAPGGLLVPAADQPIPVVLGRREIPVNARITRHPALAAHGLDAPLRFAGNNLAAHLRALRERGVLRVFVEGGPTIASAFIAAGLADEVLVYIAPALLGGPGLAIGDLGVEDMVGIRRLSFGSVERLGDDLLIRATSNHSTTAQPEEER